jgi:hypothetical protein
MTQPTKDYRKLFAESRDYWALAHEILPSAQAGDADAQFYLWKVQEDSCGSGHPYRGFVMYQGELASRDQARQWAVAAVARGTRHPQSVEEVLLFYDRCHRLYKEGTKDLGDPRDWLERATESGQPIAQAETARLRLLQEQEKIWARVGGARPTPDTLPDALLPPIGGDADPRELVRIAVESKDPEVLFEIGGLQKLLNPSQSRDEVDLNSTAWAYIACSRGFDCSYYGAPTEEPCAPTESHCIRVPEDLMKRAHGNWAPVQERVNQLNAALDAGQFDQLGLGP